MLSATVYSLTIDKSFKQCCNVSKRKPKISSQFVRKKEFKNDIEICSSLIC
jgi:hypothetical protein